MEAKPLKVLCIDGGGIKGLYSAQVLAVLEKHFNTQVYEHFDLICGTSTGGIIALAASLGIPMEDVVKFYDEYGPIIFEEKKKSHKYYKAYIKARQALWGSKYNSASLKKALETVFEDKTIKDAKTLLCIPAHNVITGQPRVFKRDYSANGLTFSSDNNKSCVDVALATSAAPTYFPAHKIGDEIFVDGGLWANNPILIGFTEYIYQFAKDPRFSGVSILSISSCEKAHGEYPHLDRGFWQWSDTLFDNYTIGQSFFAGIFLDKISQCFEKEIHFERIVNQQLSGQQESIIDLDNASAESRNILKVFGMGAANNAKVKPTIIEFFKTNKTIEIYG